VKKKPFYKVLYVQVIFAIIVGVILGHFYPALATDMKPLGDGFIKLIKMVIGPIIFCTVVTGIAGMEDMKKVGRVGGKALLYFEVVSTFALLLGLAATHILRPGVGFPNDLQDISSQPFQTVAKFTYNLGANYSFNLGENKVNAGLFWSHRSSANLYPLDQFPSKATGIPDVTPAAFTTQPAYGVLNGSLSVEVPSAHATVTVWGKNILNKRYAQTISGLVNNGLGLSFANYGPPATVGVDLTFKYR